MVDKKEYLGDSVYCNYDGYSISLTTENGFGATNEIYLEPEVIEGLLDYISRLKIEIKTITDKT